MIVLLAADFARQEEVIRLKKHENENIKTVYLIEDDKEPVTCIQKTVVNGYKGEIVIFVTIDMASEEVVSLEVAEQNETPNYGGYIGKDWFKKRFAGKNTADRLELVKMAAENQNEIVAVTGATISSKAVVRAVNITLDNYKKIREDVKDE